jgi:hypothetical protein
MGAAEKIPGLTTRRGPVSARGQAELAETIAQGHDAELVARTLDEELTKRRAQVEREVFQIVEAPGGVLSPEKAVQSWLELHAVHRLEQRLRRRIGLGEAAGKELARQLEAPGEPAASPRRSPFPHA